MKLKYYLRGAGFGIIFTTLVLMIGFSLHNTDEKIKNDVKSEPVMEAAEKTEETVSDKTASESQEKEIQPEEAAEPTEEAPLPTEAVSPENTEVEEYRPFYVEKGQSSNQVSINLAEQGFVDDAESFNKYLVELGVSDKVQPGSFYIKVGSEYEDIAALLVTKPENRKDLPAAD